MSGKKMNTPRTHHSPGFLRIIGALALAIVLAIGSSIAIVGFLTDWGRDRNPDSGPVTQPSQTAAAEAAPSSSSSTSEGTDMALRAIATAENQVRHGTVFDLEDQAEGGRRVWSAKVADPDGRQFSLMISHDGSSVVSINEDKTSEDDVRNLRSARVNLADAINTAAEHATGNDNLMSLEIDIADSDAVVWQIEFGRNDCTTVFVDATSGEVLEIGPDAD
jgi:uncharacterized membrane protein YkoI